MLQDNLFLDMNVSNTKSKNLVLESPLQQNLNKIKNWLGAPELIMAPKSYARHKQVYYTPELQGELIMASIAQSIIFCICNKLKYRKYLGLAKNVAKLY